MQQSKEAKCTSNIDTNSTSASTNQGCNESQSAIVQQVSNTNTSSAHFASAIAHATSSVTTRIWDKYLWQAHNGTREGLTMLLHVPTIIPYGGPIPPGSMPPPMGHMPMDPTTVYFVQQLHNRTQQTQQFEQ
eukprot:9570962-Ditylum_brightwellii.AAC.1